MATITPYLTFNGNCEEAFEFYKSVFGGDFEYIGRFKDMPSDTPVTGPAGEKIMHISLPIGNGSVLMGSDTNEHYGSVTIGNNFSMSINTESEEEATRLFDGLAGGGKITMPLEKTFWAERFGMFTDQFGINWMVNYDLNAVEK
ncbi:PhnB protein [Arcticibacter svalbardensis MN12-7]|uniref:PhnB protein n=1 Tax=Arcticibacter svalbardensis MN12-7 TaxID=1150600 RepID=R9H5X9_9SPHI|nr:VOC family protein [Arcticibacter svalbardensis]EOR96569.1 PhnB protein [Arcticibacter svalbardensis MN12-7]